MIKRKDELPITVNEKMRGGDGSVTLAAMLTPDEMYNKGRVFSTLSLQPGCSIGYHVHENEMETFYIVKGTCEFDDNGTQTYTLTAGDVAYTAAGNGHSVRNTGTDELLMIALILFNA